MKARKPEGKNNLGKSFWHHFSRFVSYNHISNCLCIKGHQETVPPSSHLPPLSLFPSEFKMLRSQMIYALGRQQRNGNCCGGREVSKTVRKAANGKTQKAPFHGESRNRDTKQLLPLPKATSSSEVDLCPPPHRLDGAKGQPTRGALCACSCAWKHMCAWEVRRVRHSSSHPQPLAELHQAGMVRGKPSHLSGALPTWGDFFLFLL